MLILDLHLYEKVNREISFSKRNSVGIIITLNVFKP